MQLTLNKITLSWQHRPAIPVPKSLEWIGDCSLENTSHWPKKLLWYFPIWKLQLNWQHVYCLNLLHASAVRVWNSQSTVNRFRRSKRSILSLFFRQTSLTFTAVFQQSSIKSFWDLQCQGRGVAYTEKHAPHSRWMIWSLSFSLLRGSLFANSSGFKATATQSWSFIRARNLLASFSLLP